MGWIYNVYFEINARSLHPFSLSGFLSPHTREKDLEDDCAETLVAGKPGCGHSRAGIKWMGIVKKSERARSEGRMNLRWLLLWQADKDLVKRDRIPWSIASFLILLFSLT
jgi:hypothetical protein